MASPATITFTDVIVAMSIWKKYRQKRLEASITSFDPLFWPLKKQISPSRFKPHQLKNATITFADVEGPHGVIRPRAALQ